MNSECKSFLNWNRIKRFYGVLLVLAILLLAGCKKKMNFQEYLDLGNKYLLELNYEEAAVAFSKAIELEPRELGAYEKLAEVYGAQGNTSQALETLNQAISMYENLPENEKTEERTIVYNRICDAILRSEFEVYMDQLLYLKQELDGNLADFGNGRFGGEEILGENFRRLAKKLKQPVIWQQEDGSRLAVYPNGYVYAGFMEDSMRSGQGGWYFEEARRSYVFKGIWKQDYPNGSGVEKEFTRYDTGGTAMLIIEADYRDGKENGSAIWNTVSAEVIAGESLERNAVYQLDITDGVPDKLEQEPRHGNTVAVMTKLSGTGGTWTWAYREGEPWGVQGAMKK